MSAHIKVSSDDILGLFAKISQNLGFQLIEREANFATSVYKAPFSFKNIFKKCLPPRNGPAGQSLSAIRLQIMIDEQSQLKKIFLKSLYGDNAILTQFIIQFKAKFKDVFEGKSEPSQGFNDGTGHKTGGTILVGSENEVTIKSMDEETDGSYMDETFSQTIGTTSIKPKANAQATRQIQPSSIVLFQPTGSFHQHNQAYYHYHKILSDDSYTLGRNVDEFINSYFIQYKSTKESSELLP